MKLQDIQPDCKINITVSRKDTSANLTTDMAYAFADGILVVPFMHDGAMVSFDAPELIIEMIATRQGEVPYMWKNVQITKATYENKLYHCIKTGTVGVKLNRRGAFRVFVGENGSAIDTKTQNRRPVLVKDISSSGVGILFDRKDDPEYELGSGVAVFFSDNSLNTDFELATRIVRRVELEENGKILYGCMFSKKYPKVDRYCATKQIRNRQEARKNKNENAK